MMKSAVYSVAAALVAVVSLGAQESSSWTFQVGIGFTQPVGRTWQYTDSGWNTSAGIGFNFNPYIGALVDVNVDDLGISPSTLNAIGIPGGDISVFSATLDPIVHLMPHSNIDVYITGGGGEYRYRQNFVPAFFPTTYGAVPYFGLTGSSNRLVYDSTVNKPGVDIGMGIAVGTKWHGKFYAEAKYDKIFMGGYHHVDYVPVTFGFRW